MQGRTHRLFVLLIASSMNSARTACAAELDGWWVSDGFGRVLEVQGEKVKAYELTAISCLPVWEVDGKLDGSNAISLLQNGCQRRLSLDAATGLARLSADCCQFDFLWQRLAERPKLFGQNIENTPQMNYAIFWQTFKENYPFFALHHVDWDRVDRVARPMVTADTTPNKLFEIFRGMTKNLYDAHVYLEAPDLKMSVWGRRPIAHRLGPWQSTEWLRLMDIIKTKYVPGLKDYCQNKIHFGMVDGGIAYLCINSFGAFVPGANAQEQNQAMDAALDEIFQNSKDWKGLIIDVRVHSGGLGRMDLSLASRLTGERYLAYTTEARNNLNGPLHFTPPQSAWVNPRTRPRYDGKVVILMGRDTVSCVEDFVLATMGRKPPVLRVGEPTQGVFSEVLMRKLPNGWTFGLPNQIYRTAEGKSFDGVGIPPDVSVPVFTEEELTEGRDSGMEKAIEMIRK
jgi:hypothetical protein